MNHKPRANSVVTTRLNDRNNIEIMVIGAGAIEFNPKTAHANMRNRAEIHGWTQRLCDKAALGFGSTPKQKYDAIKSLVDHYRTGIDQWSVRSSETQVDEFLETLVRALMIAKPNKTETDIRTWLAGKSKAERAKVFVSSEIREIIAEMEGADDDSDVLAGLE